MNTDISTITVQTMSSLEIAKLTGKQHKNVLADIRKMLDDLEIQSADFSAVYKNQQLIDRPCFNLPKRETSILVSGYNIKMRAAIIDRWQELESQPQKISQPPQYLRFLEHVKKVPVGYYSMIMVMQNGFTTPMSVIQYSLAYLRVMFLGTKRVAYNCPLPF